MAESSYSEDIIKLTEERENLRMQQRMLTFSEEKEENREKIVALLGQENVINAQLDKLEEAQTEKILRQKENERLEIEKKTNERSNVLLDLQKKDSEVQLLREEVRTKKWQIYNRTTAGSIGAVITFFGIGDALANYLPYIDADRLIVTGCTVLIAAFAGKIKGKK